MAAIVQRRYGGAETLAPQTIDRPAPGPEEVLIEVHAAGADRGTWHLMTGLPYLVRFAGFGVRAPKQPVPGLDVAGRVVEVGSAVTRFSVGDEVFGIGTGAWAEYAVAREEKLAHKPSVSTFAEAAGAAVSGITALQALTDVGRVQPGQTVLVLGASGGVGTFAVQLAKALGAEVTGVGRPETLELIRSLGADRVVDRTREDPLAGVRRYDLIIDAGGGASVRRLRRALTPRGTLVIVGSEGGNRLTGGTGRQLRAMLLSPFVGQRLTAFVSKEHHSSIERLAEFIERGEVTPAVGRRFALGDAAAAMRLMEAGAASGKSVIVVRPGGEDR